MRPHPAELRQMRKPGPPERRPRPPEPVRERRPADDRGARQPGYDRGGKPSAPDRRSDTGPVGPRPVPAGARQANAARAGGPGQAAGWDSLSDVDYWAEVASDKPLPSADAPTAIGVNPAKRSRRGIEPKADAPRPADLPAARADSGPLPTRQRSRSRSGTGPYGGEAATQSLAALGRPEDQPPPSQQRALPSRGGSSSRQAPAQRTGSAQPAGAAPLSPNGQRPAGGRQGTGQRPASGPRPGGNGHRPAASPRALPPALPQSPAAQVSHSGGQPRPPLPMDDDPLTSPSFPAINDSDSRSYSKRSRSSSVPSSSQPSSSQPLGLPSGGGRGGSYPEPARHLPAYPAGPDHSTSAPNGYPVQPAATAAGHGPASAAPAANPYGSYVSTPQPSYPEPASAHFDAAAYGTGYAAGQQAVAAANWYGGNADGNQAINGYLPTPGNGNGAGNGYSPADYGNGYQTPVYQGGQPALPAGGYGQNSHPGPNEQRGHHRSDAGYGQDGYEGYPGYGGAAR